MNKFTTIFFSVLFFSTTVLAARPPRALVYNGPGACPEDCAKAAGEMAVKAGYAITYVKDSKDFDKAAKGATLWMHPGGKTATMVDEMDPALKEKIRGFIAGGAGYVGFCAGAYIASENFKNRVGERKGLGLLPMRGDLFEVAGNPWETILTTKVGSKDVQTYWEGGPYLTIDPAKASEVEAWTTYADGKTAGVRGKFGKGKVIVTGVHPEAPLWWRTSSKLVDDDGLDFSIAVDMIKWATK